MEDPAGTGTMRGPQKVLAWGRSAFDTSGPSIPGPAVHVPEDGIPGLCLHLLVFLFLFMARETGFPFLVVTRRFPFEKYLLK